MLVHAVEVLLSPSFVPFSPLPYMICTALTHWYSQEFWLAFSHWYTLTVWLALGVCYRFKEFGSLLCFGTLRNDGSFVNDGTLHSFDSLSLIVTVSGWVGSLFFSVTFSVGPARSLTRPTASSVG